MGLFCFYKEKLKLFQSNYLCVLCFSFKINESINDVAWKENDDQRNGYALGVLK